MKAPLRMVRLTRVRPVFVKTITPTIIVPLSEIRMETRLRSLPSRRGKRSLMMVIAFPRSEPRPKPKNGSPTTIRRASPSNTMSSAARPSLQHKHSNRSLPGRAACLGNGSYFRARHKQPSIGTHLNFITPADYTSEVRSWHAAVRAAFSVAILRNDDRLRPALYAASLKQTASSTQSPERLG